jgi:hypothetical protein
MAAMMLSLPGLQAMAEPLRLENAHIVVQIDQKTGAVRSIHDKELKVDYVFSGIGFEFTTAEGTVRAENAEKVTTRDDGVKLHFEQDGFTAALYYRLGPEDRFIEKWFEVQSSDGRPFFLKSVVLEDLTTEAFKDIHLHDDNTIWQCPINLFLRGEKGGCFAGLEYPYWDLEQKGTEGFRLGFQPNVQVAAETPFVSEIYFLGTYRYEGIYRYSQGPYPGPVPSPYINFAETGLKQHFKDGKIPAAAVKPEVLDWGEVWAMQAFMEHVLPDLPLPEEGYWIWQNGWWAGLFDPQTATLDTLKEAGIHDIMTAHTWYGRGNHPRTPPYLIQMRIEPMGFPKDDGIAGMPGKAGPAAGLHVESDDVVLNKFIPNEFTPEFIAPPAMEAFHEYGREIGVHVSSFSKPGLYFENRPEWASIDENGKVSEYLFGTQVSCPAVDDYMNHCLELLDHVFTKYKPRWWGFDGRWLSYWEVPRYRRGGQGGGFDLCYAENHGHLPGDNLYKEWKNINHLLAELKRRHPEVCLEQYYGLKRGGPWALRHVNCDENYYESTGAMVNRFQTWHNQNDRFRPVYKNYAGIFRDFRMNVLSTISVTSYAQISRGFVALSHEDSRNFLKHWRDWATRNHDYLKVKRDLFDCPGLTPVDGSAHIIKDRGFIFLFSPAYKGKTVRASIPLNRWIQLEENPDAVYRIKEIYPNEGKELATLRYGDDFTYDMPRNAAVVLALEPAPKGSPISPSTAVNQEADVQVIPAFSTVGAVPQASVGEFWLRENGTKSGEKPAATKESADLPRVLLIGDSISLGYEPLVRKRLAGITTVVHPPENCRSTIHGLKRIDTWLGEGSWDVIHFNWGIWDAHHVAGNLRTTPEEYEQNLSKLVSRLKATGAKLIWASSTPITGRVGHSRLWVEGAEIPLRNRIAQKVMEQNGILMNDLYTAILPQTEEFHHKDRAHFTPEGYDFLARYVAESIEGVLNIPAEQVP